MNETSLVGELLDKLAIADLIQFERIYRDQHQWEQLRAVYHPDSLIRLGWFVGTGSEYVEASRRLAARKEGWHITHLTSPTLVRVHKDRAIAGTNTVIIRRETLEGVLVDATIYCNLYSRVERREGTWKMLTLDVIYEKDRVIPVYPSDHLELNREELEKGLPAYRFTTYNLRKIGYTAGDDLYTTDHPERVAQLYSEAESWLHQD